VKGSNEREPRKKVGHGGLYLPAAAAEHLRAAVEQTELLLNASQVDAGMRHLLRILRHLRAVRRRMD